LNTSDEVALKSQRVSPVEVSIRVLRMRPQSVTIEEIDQTIASPRLRLAFPPRLETRYEADHGPLRQHHLALSAFWFAVCYGLFLGVDVRLVPDVFFESALLHLGVMVPLGFAVALITARVTAAVVRESASAVLTVASVATILWMFEISDSPSAAHYHYLAAMPILFGNVVQRPHFPYAVGASVISLALYWAAMASSALPPEVAVAASLELAATVVVTLVAGFHMERELRSAYLRKLRVDITADTLSTTNDELRQLSHLDTLTGIANRRWLEAHLAEMAEQSRRAGGPLAVMMIDIDHFKGVNDQFGHAAGDLVLKELARCYHETMREADLICRYGGEEFCILLPESDQEGAKVAAERLLEAIRSRDFTANHHGVKITVSIGVAAGSESSKPLDQWIEEADKALMKAKEEGRDRVSYWG